MKVGEIWIWGNEERTVFNIPYFEERIKLIKYFSEADCYQILAWCPDYKEWHIPLRTTSDNKNVEYIISRRLILKHFVKEK